MLGITINTTTFGRIAMIGITQHCCYIAAKGEPYHNSRSLSLFSFSSSSLSKTLKLQIKSIPLVFQPPSQSLSETLDYNRHFQSSSALRILLRPRVASGMGRLSHARRDVAVIVPELLTAMKIVSRPLSNCMIVAWHEEGIGR